MIQTERLSDQPINTEVKNVLPKIEHGEEFDAPDMEYSVTVDPLKLSSMLSEFGMSDEAIERLNVRIRRRPNHLKIRGEYRPVQNCITLFTDNDWESYQGNMQTAKAHLQNAGQSESSPIFIGKIPKRLPHYLSVAPAERGLAFADEVFSNEMNKEINRTLLHEVNHALERKYMLLTILGAASISVLLNIAYRSFISERIQGDVQRLSAVIGYICANAAIINASLDLREQGEERARKFEYEQSKIPTNNNIVKLVPLQEEEF